MMKEPNAKKSFQNTFFDDAVVSPDDRPILILEAQIVDCLGQDGAGIGPYLDQMTLPDIISLLSRYDLTLGIRPSSTR